MNRPSSAFLRPLQTPSRPFVTFLAAAGFAGALLLTPPTQLDSSPFAVIIAPRGATLPAVPADSATLEREVVNRYDHLPLAQIFRRRAEPEIAEPRRPSHREGSP